MKCKMFFAILAGILFNVSLGTAQSGCHAPYPFVYCDAALKVCIKCSEVPGPEAVRQKNINFDCTASDIMDMDLL